jgi:DNA-binding CsgD family transcriptional regulator
MAAPKFEVLLRSAINLVEAGTAPQGEHVAIGTRQFRLVTQKAGRSWLVILVEDRPEPTCEEIIQARFGLTKREAQVARLLAERCPNSEIGKQLGIGEHTVRRHTSRVLKKLGINRRRDVRALVMDE